MPGRNDYIKRWKQAKREQGGTKLCECGCGTTIYALNASLKPAQVANGHKKRKHTPERARELRLMRRERWLQAKIAEAGTKRCDCGCGQEIPAVTTALEPRKYAAGHARPTPWKKPGDTLRHSQGYVLEYAPDHPRAHNGYVYQHILVWERRNGRLVPNGFHIHHVNGVKDDNRVENLEMLSAADHSRLHMTSDVASRRAAMAAEARWGARESAENPSA